MTIAAPAGFSACRKVCSSPFPEAIWQGIFKIGTTSQHKPHQAMARLTPLQHEAGAVLGPRWNVAEEPQVACQRVLVLLLSDRVNRFEELGCCAGKGAA